jgi:dihydroxyacetone kinase-like predicted kinase
LRAANDALDRTPEQLPVLKEAGVVDSGGAGFVYFLEGVLRFLPDQTVRATAFPRRPVRSAVFTKRQSVGENCFCTEFILEQATIEAHPLRDLLAHKGDSLLVIGAAPTIKVHIHTGHPDDVQALAAKHGTLTRIKVENMAEQHNVLIDAPHKAFSVAAVVPGAGYETMARELGAEVTIPTPDGANPAVRDLLLGVNATLSDIVYLLPNDSNVALAAREVAALTTKTVIVVPTRDIVQGLAAMLDLGAAEAAPPLADIEARIGDVRSGSVFYAGKDTTIAGVAVKKGAPTAQTSGKLVAADTMTDALYGLAKELGADEGGLLTIYYGGSQKERDAQRAAAELGETFAEVNVEYYFGGQTGIEYWVSFER